MITKKISEIFQFNSINKEYLKYNIYEMQEEKKKNVIIFHGYSQQYNFSGNLKFLFLGFYKKNKNRNLKIYYLTQDKRIYNLLKKYKLPVIFFDKKNPSKNAVKIINKAKVVISDYDFSFKEIGQILYALYQDKTKILLYHGRFNALSNKNLPKYNIGTYFSDLFNFSRFIHRQSYDYLLGPYKKFEISIAVKMFWKFKKIYNSGYILADIFKKKIDKYDLINVDIDSYNSLSKKLMKNTNILYCPSSNVSVHGFKGRDINLLSHNIDFVKLNKILKRNNLFFYIKLHKVDCHLYTKKILKSKLSNIKFIDPYSDLTPLLNMFDICISDRSSIILDFIFLRKTVYKSVSIKDINETNVKHDFFFNKILNSLNTINNIYEIDKIIKLENKTNKTFNISKKYFSYYKEQGKNILSFKNDIIKIMNLS